MSRHVTSLVVTSTTHVSPFTLFSLLYLSLSSPSTMHTSCPFPSETAISLLHNDEAHGEPRATRATDSSFISFSKRSFLFQPAPCFRRSSTSLFAELTRASLYSKPLSATQTLIRRLPPPSSFTYSLWLALSRVSTRVLVTTRTILQLFLQQLHVTPFFFFFRSFVLLTTFEQKKSPRVQIERYKKMDERLRRLRRSNTVNDRPTQIAFMEFNYIFNYILSLIPNLRCGIKRLCYVISVKIFRCVSRYLQ